MAATALAHRPRPGRFSARRAGHWQRGRWQPLPPSSPRSSSTRADLAWAAFLLASLAAIVLFSRWETLPLHLIWISLTLVYGFRLWSVGPTLWVLTLVVATTFAAIAWDVWRGAQSLAQLDEVPLMGIMFGLMVWHAQRQRAADIERSTVSEENARLLSTQRMFLQDASHQLRTPITIALGHAELLARELADRSEGRDIEVVVGELTRLRRLGERLLVIAASQDPEFLLPERVALDLFAMDMLRRWAPTAPRRWELGQLDAALVSADPERLGLAVDALLENAVRHTGAGDTIRLSAVAGEDTASIIVADTGTGIPPTELERIFGRFATTPPPGGSRGTGLGLPLVRAVARAHSGDVHVRSAPGAGSEFAIVLPSAAATQPTPLEDPWTSGTR